MKITIYNQDEVGTQVTVISNGALFIDSIEFTPDEANLLRQALNIVHERLEK